MGEDFQPPRHGVYRKGAVSMAEQSNHVKSNRTTLGDKIRQMSDEELAKWLVEHDRVCWSKGHLDEFGYLSVLKRKAR